MCYQLGRRWLPLTRNLSDLWGYRYFEGAGTARKCSCHALYVACHALCVACHALYVACHALYVACHALYVYVTPSMLQWIDGSSYSYRNRHVTSGSMRTDVQFWRGYRGFHRYMTWYETAINTSKNVITDNTSVSTHIISLYTTIYLVFFTADVLQEFTIRQYCGKIDR